jgi:dTDP-glucose 4,6-dehydratase
MKHAVVTGGAGFIGSHLVEKLLISSEYSHITVIDRLSEGGSLSNLDLSDSRLTFLPLDITNFEQLKIFFSTLEEKEFDIFHLAAESHVDRSIRSGLPFVHSNLVGTQCLLECAIKFKANRMLHVSTDEVYGSLLESEANEKHQLNPSSTYSASKAGSDLLTLSAGITHKLDVVVTRCVNNFGTRQAPEKFIPRMILKALLGLRMSYGCLLSVGIS